MKFSKWCALLCIFASILACKPDTTYLGVSAEPVNLHRALDKLTEIIVYDIFSPPVASRIYAYASIAAYETICQDSSDHPSLVGHIAGLKPLPRPINTDVNLNIACVFAFANVGRALIFSEAKMDEFLADLRTRYREAGVPRRVLTSSEEYARIVESHIMEWANLDNYNQTRTFPKFDIRDEPGRWQPTPPDYMEGIEPHWRDIRTLVIDSATQFTPPLPTEYDLDEGSVFYQEVEEVYETVNNLDEEQEAIAQFWDCNPYVSHHKGHVMFATKKITPGGHWMGIAQIAAKNSGGDMVKTAKTLAWTSIALFDAFISCWDEKYRSNLIRPETVINKYIDEDWVPLLQTPPFPEYTSGHSVISSAAAIMLTSIYGDPFPFEDTVELTYGLPMRKFNSFLDASAEAAISRLYGGIHYMPAIDNGVTQGQKLGRFVVDKLPG